MEIMDPFAYELLARPPPPGYDPFSCGGAMNTAVTVDQMDDYFRAVGVLPPLPPAVVPPTSGYTTPAATLCGAMDYAMEVPVKCELYAAAIDAQIQPGAVDVPAVPLPAPAAPASDDGAAALKNSVTPYDADIDATLRAMENDARERPSPDYLDTTQRGRMDPVARASLVLWMCEFSLHFDLGAATLHRAVSYADRFLSVRPLAGDPSYERQLRLLGAAAVYAAAKYEDRGTTWKLNARDIASACGFAASQEVLDTERALVAALGYRLGGPSADTFVDHFTRHSQGQEEDLDVQRTAHRLADKSLFDHRFMKLLPSAVAAAAIFLARLALKPSHDPEQVRRLSRELEELTGYKPMDVYDGVDCKYRLMHAPGFEISPLFFVDSR
ncbi:putative cyclin-F2-1 [Phragmites australis]|uniref:putative cyclin-F2-1 n=1 Tax=Phragmites australis TaxID=29695 RepID=UPI002D77A60B|nr:putative cyclin-F2-1 [Phragmites australis]